MISIKHTIRFFLKENGSIVMRVRWAQKRFSVDLCLGIFAESAKWDSDKQCAKVNTTHKVGRHTTSARTINCKIRDAQAHVSEYFARQEVNGICPTSTEFKKVFDEYLHPDKKVIEIAVRPNSLNDLMKAYFNEKAHNWKPRSKYRYQQAVNYAYEIDPHITVDKIDKAFMFRMVNWFIDGNHLNGTTNSRVGAIKTLLRWGAKNEFPVLPEAFEAETNVKDPVKKVVFLHYDELQKLNSYKFGPEHAHLGLYRDLWCFMAYTSLRVSDLGALKRIDIQSGDYIDLYQIKTDKHVKIPLLPEAKTIIQRYEEANGNKVFPEFYDQKLNQHIKEIAKLVGLSREIAETYYIGRKKIDIVKPLHEAISNHDARRTFICCSIKFGIVPTVVMQMTGHSDYDSMRPYIDVADETVDHEMIKWEQNPQKIKIINLLKTASPEQMENAIKALSSTEKALV